MDKNKKESRSMKRLIINGDDYGLNEHCSKAIAQAFDEGLITDTTMMANGEYFDQAVQLARERGFIDNIGIHLNLTWGVPLTEDIKKCPRFVTDGHFTKDYDRTRPLHNDEKAAIEKELRAQIEKISAAGIKINHADSHHHIHTGVFIAPIAARVCREKGIDKMRLHRNAGNISFVKRIVKNKYNKWLHRQGFKTTAFFAYVVDLAGSEIPDDTEVMVHPDFDGDGKLVDRRGMENDVPFGEPIPVYTGDPEIKLRGYSQL